MSITNILKEKHTLDNSHYILCFTGEVREGDEFPTLSLGINKICTPEVTGTVGSRDEWRDCFWNTIRDVTTKSETHVIEQKEYIPSLEGNTTIIFDINIAANRIGIKARRGVGNVIIGTDAMINEIINDPICEHRKPESNSLFLQSSEKFCKAIHFQLSLFQRVIVRIKSLLESPILVKLEYENVKNEEKALKQLGLTYRGTISGRGTQRLYTLENFEKYWDDCDAIIAYFGSNAVDAPISCRENVKENGKIDYSFALIDQIEDKIDFSVAKNYFVKLKKGKCNEST